MNSPTQIDPLGHRGAARTGAFTLIELLVVVAIVGILAGLVMAVFGRTGNTAKTAVTIANLRTLQQANAAHAAENNGQYVPLMTGTWSGGWKWNDDFLRYVGVTDFNSKAWKKVMHSGFWSDPKYQFATLAYNGYKTPGSPAPWSSTKSPLRMVDPERAATLIAFMDADDWWVDPYRYDRWVSREASDVPGRSPGASPAYRNANRTAAAVTFAGNVVMLTQEELDWRTPEGRSRWFYDGKQ